VLFSSKGGFFFINNTGAYIFVLSKPESLPVWAVPLHFDEVGFQLCSTGTYS
jgi:hypothetical protein